MKAIVVFESHWGNTATIARAVAEGMGAGTRAMSTAQATQAMLHGVDLIVAGAPLIGFALPGETMVRGLKDEVMKGAPPPDLSHPAMRTWLEALPKGKGVAAAFETRIWWSPGSAAKAILRLLGERGYSELTPGKPFIVTDRYGPLREGELEAARAWGAELARTGLSLSAAALPSAKWMEKRS